jgi:hypothetical protein
LIPPGSDATILPRMLVDSDGTLHFGPRSVPPPALESPDARRSYVPQMLAGADIRRPGRLGLRTNPGGQTRAGGVGVTIYSPRQIPAKNRKKVLGLGFAPGIGVQPGILVGASGFEPPTSWSRTRLPSPSP